MCKRVNDQVRIINRLTLKRFKTNIRINHWNIINHDSNFPNLESIKEKSSQAVHLNNDLKISSN